MLETKRRRCWSVCSRRTGGYGGKMEEEKTCLSALRCWRWAPHGPKCEHTPFSIHTKKNNFHYFIIFQVEVNRCSRVQCVVEQAASSVYMDSRSVTLRGTLSPGRYVVLPTTFLPGATGNFLLRLFSHSHVRLRCVTVCLIMTKKSFFCS